MSKLEVNTVEPQCGTTLTLGACGQTVALGSGATATGFGREGSVDWQTGDIKTGDFTAATGKGYFINTTSGTVTATLPASPTAGDIVGLKDYALTWDTNSMFIGRNGKPINGGTGTTLEISTEGATILLVYVDGTKGWIPTQDDASALIPVTPTYVAATGGTPCAGTTVGDYKIHSFTGPGTLCVSAAGNCAGNNKIDYLVVAGGGGGGWDRGGGGGAGGFRESKQTGAPWSASPIATCVGITAAVQGYPIVVGGGGAAPGAGQGVNGVNSSFSTITSAGGGGGGAANPGAGCNATAPGVAGGSGGGASSAPQDVKAGGAGNTPPVSPVQGFVGGSSAPGSCSPSGALPGAGGGGATAQGVNTPAGPGSGNGPVGGAGGTTTISNTPTAYAGGGGGASSTCDSGGGTGGAGGAGGGGAGADSPGTNVGTAGTTNTGGGGGGGGNGTSQNAGGAGGSGIVIIRYKFQ